MDDQNWGYAHFQGFEPWWLDTFKIAGSLWRVNFPGRIPWPQRRTRPHLERRHDIVSGSDTCIEKDLLTSSQYMLLEALAPLSPFFLIVNRRKGSNWWLVAALWSQKRAKTNQRLSNMAGSNALLLGAAPAKGGRRVGVVLRVHSPPAVLHLHSMDTNLTHLWPMCQSRNSRLNMVVLQKGRDGRKQEVRWLYALVFVTLDELVSASLGPIVTRVNSCNAR